MKTLGLSERATQDLSKNRSYLQKNLLSRSHWSLLNVYDGFIGGRIKEIYWPLRMVLDFSHALYDTNSRSSIDSISVKSDDVNDIEKFQLPPDRNVWIMVIVNALVGTFLSDYLWLLSVLMTSPLVVTLGLSLTIPLALFGDSVFKGIIMSPGYWLGALLVVGGFLGVNLATVKENRREHRFTSLIDDECGDYDPVSPLN
ncbi:16646_t:CDS:2 [Acaulospora colombiana]|uniref:16646_t:CDS:1 n=1 Tax=Acaulospora colombiana TaxID=27376 RepID=A0ACA9JY76_9GLOM|nr:16646_t:CDS:2 [Acaulospora colombiana]